MGYAKEEILEKEENWKSKAENAGWRCSVCNHVPPYSEREIYFETGMCGLHDHQSKKDD
jgi:hypothetical protein